MLKFCFLIGDCVAFLWYGILVFEKNFETFILEEQV